MAITLSDDHELFINGERIMFPRDGNHSPSSFLSGLDENDDVVFGRFTPDGKLKVEGDFGVPSIYPEVDMRARDVANIAQLMQVEVDPVTGRYALLVNDPRLAFNGDKLKVDASINLTDTGGEEINIYDEITNKIFAAYHTIVSYTVPANHIFRLRHVSVSGSNKASYRVLWGMASIIAKKRTYYTSFNEDFFFEADDTLGTTFVAGDTVYVDVTHSNSTANGDFNATISGRLEAV
jgi:hypothetical protein